MKPNTHIQAQLQLAQANQQSQNCKRACLFSYAFLSTPKTIFFGHCSASIELISGCDKLITN
jgi:hypothetical protein